ncbi:MAG: anti-sigma factor [Phormidesmis sp.]
MNGTVLPEEQELLMAGYVLGDLSQEESQQFEQLLVANPHLQNEIVQLQQSLDAAYGAQVSPPAHLKNSILDAVNQTAEQTAQTVEPSVNREPSSPSPVPPPARASQPSTPKRFIQWAVSGLAIVAALIAAALGVQNYTLRQALEGRESLPTAQSETDQLTFALTSDDSETGEVELVINPAQSSGQLEAQGLPPLDEGKVYVLWTVVEENTPVTTDEKNAILTAVFTVDEAGSQSQQITVPSVYRDPSLLKAVAVTIEDADAPQAHQSAPILIEQL